MCDFSSEQKKIALPMYQYNLANIIVNDETNDKNIGTENQHDKNQNQTNR